jgi:hypothetical protein
MAVYEATEKFADEIERTGLSKIELARLTAMSRYTIDHIAARRQRASGAKANKIALVVAERRGIDQDAALRLLFVQVANKKGADVERRRGPGGRFVTSKESLADYEPR